MIKVFGMLIFILFLISNISAICNETQIDINSANLTELQGIKHVGNATATKIIAARPFSSINDLARVKGIGNKTYLEDIIAQELACVNEETNNSITIKNLNDNYSAEIINDTPKIIAISNKIADESANKTQEIVNLIPISLNAQNIKSGNNTETLKRNLSFYGLIAICVIFGALFLFKNRKRKNEFN